MCLFYDRLLATKIYVIKHNSILVFRLHGLFVPLCKARSII